MTRTTQFAATLAIALLTVQPVLASLPCDANPASACVPGCRMNMSSMGADCPMAGLIMDASCGQNCCAQAGLQTLAPAVAAEKLRIAVVAGPLVLHVAQAPANRVAGIERIDQVRGDSPPRYIVNQVFRI